jgi:carbohydrate-binding DOMON domain-containing protein
LTVSAPANQSAINGSPLVVTGTTVAGNTVSVAATNTDTGFATATAQGTAAADGSFSISVAVTPGTTVLSVVATAAGGGTAHATRTVVWDFVPGTLILDVTDPSGDDNGPGNYAYPTAGDFHAGAFDITDFQVYDDSAGSGNIIFRLQTRDLSPTFGSPLGAQLVDVYVHEPGASPTSTAASFPGRNYTIAPGSAWSRLLEVQGFGQRFVDATNTNTVGTITISANQISRYITFSVDKAALGGTPASGWIFTVVLTGQDGFSPDQARGFQPTPQPFQFGVCATASSDPHCTVNPATVPKAVDVLTPSSVTQSDELDYTKHQPVVISGVAIP